MSNKKRIWSKEELTIAYFIAKWGIGKLNLSPTEIAEGVIGNTTENSLSKQVANFRYLLSIDGYQLKDYSVAMRELSEELQNKTYTQVYNIVLEYIDSRVEDVKSMLVKKHNEKANSKVDELNSLSEVNYKNNVKMASIGRNLKYVGKRKA